jgi:DNA-binding NtrC family response regulator
MSGNTTTKDPPVRILLVDDEAGFVDVLVKRLVRRGFEAGAAYSGDEAVRMLRHKEFDIAVLDLKMEGMDGLEVLKIFKVMAPELPVIILTGHGCLSSAEEGIRIGAADYISKPYDFDMLVEKIRSITKKG